jgi:hypothetical protein
MLSQDLILVLAEPAAQREDAERGRTVPLSGPRQSTPIQAAETSAFRRRGQSEWVYVIEVADLAQNAFGYDVSRLDMLRVNGSCAGAPGWKPICEFLIVKSYPHDKRAGLDAFWVSPRVRMSGPARCP